MDKWTGVKGCANHPCGDGKQNDRPTGNSLTSWREPHDSTSNVPQPVQGATPATNIREQTI
jgi:hypothetical protein